MDTTLLDLLQLADSSFPSGSYAHSLGLEWLCRQPAFNLEASLRLRLSQNLARLELPVLRAAYEGPSASKLLELDHLMDVLTPATELREASRSIGRSFIRAAALLRPQGLAAIAVEQGVEHQPVVFGAVFQDWNLPLPDGLSSYALQAVRQQLSAAQRLSLIGQSEAQQLLHRLKPAALAAVERSRGVSMEEAGACAPWLDLAGIRHRELSGRLFMS